MTGIPEYWRHKKSGSLYGHNPHVNFNKDGNYEKLSDDEVLDYLGKVNPSLAEKLTSGLRTSGLESEPKVKKKRKKKKKIVGRPSRITPDDSSESLDLDDLLG